VLGAAALGVRNILCLSGDHSSLGPMPHSRMDIWDLDSIQLIWMLRRMRDEGHFLDEREIKVTPSVFIGAAGSPNSSTLPIQARRETKKVNAGAQFFQTNLIYDAGLFERYLAMLDQAGVLNRVYILAGVSPIRSLKAAQMMNKVPGIKIPEAVIRRMESSRDPKEEGIQVALEIIQKVKGLPGVKGIHFMAVGWESVVPRLAEESGLQALRNRKPAGE
ncbi:MAG: methylenetetrahydrofolate reductase, partial [Anaerolineaceae bacterium]